ncbi:MAG: hypothetical protein JWP37_4539 [Mucilaginibacter sp.]|nr:hypothetical protein [Mucilaginibacter sp.]
MAFLSCKKDHSKDNNPVSKLQKVAFKMGFAKSTGSFQTNSLIINSTTADTSLTNHIDVLYYMVFDSVGNNVHNITQLASDTAFGHYTDNLHSGKYTVAIAGGKTGLMISSGSLTQQYLFYGVIYPTVSGSYLPGPFDQDAFFYRSAITVGNTSSSQNISLSRIVSKLIVNINDAIPTNTKQAQLTLSYYANKYFVGDGSTGTYHKPSDASTTYAYTYDITSTDWGKTNYQLSTLFLYNNSPMTVDLWFADNSSPGRIEGEKTISNITGQANKVSKLSGNLFGGAGVTSIGGFKVTVDSLWNTPVIRTFP